MMSMGKARAKLPRPMVQTISTLNSQVIEAHSAGGIQPRELEIIK